jgi:trans-aconitate methyltransferase
MLENIRYKINLAMMKKKYYFSNTSPYIHAARVYDFFSQQIFQPSLYQFREQLSKLLKDKIRIADIGAGTGLLSQQLLELQPTAKLSVIEPSPDMNFELEYRLKDQAEHYECTLQDCWDSLPPQDLLIFERSLFHFPNYEAPLEGLAKILYQLTNEGGTIAIYDDFEEFSIEKIKKTYAQQANKNKLNDQFNEYWPYYETLLRKHNDLSKKGGLTTIDPTLLKNCFENAGFQLTLWKDGAEIIALFNKPG